MPVVMYDNADKGDASSNQSPTLNFYPSGSPSGNTTYYIMQTLEGGDNYEERVSFKSSGTWYPTERFVGFTIKEYRHGTSGSWTPITPSGSFSPNRNGTYVRFSRNQHHFVMSSNNMDFDYYFLTQAEAELLGDQLYDGWQQDFSVTRPQYPGYLFAALQHVRDLLAQLAVCPQCEQYQYDQHREVSQQLHFVLPEPLLVDQRLSVSA